MNYFEIKNLLMVFEANTDISLKCINKYKRTAYLSFPIFFVLLAFLILVDYYSHHNLLFTIFLLIFTIAILCLVPIYALRKGAALINKMIAKIEINKNEILFRTFDISLFFGMIKRDSIIATANRDQTQFRISQINYAFDKALTKEVYLLIYFADEYLVVENFFSDFKKIKSELEN